MGQEEAEDTGVEAGEIIRTIKVPTGCIVVMQGSRGLLELLSIGDYGKEVNLKCDALGLTKDLHKVTHAGLLPLDKKWVITISTQYGCSMGCTFCDVPRVGRGTNATVKDMVVQLEVGKSMYPDVTRSDRLNVHFARMGEPSWNPDVIAATEIMNALYGERYNLHPVVSTMMPAHNKHLMVFIRKWMDIKNHEMKGNAGLQLSINSTSQKERDIMFNKNASSFDRIALIMDGVVPVGRKITLNFAVADYEIDPEVLLNYFPPEHYIIKLTPMHKTATALANGIETEGDYTTFYPYADHERRLKAAGYDVLVFIASVEEDLGLITCGNAVLSGSEVPEAYRRD